MSEMQWIAAALAPADVAPHPNFFSTDSRTAASQFALVCSARWADLARISAEGHSERVIELAEQSLASDAGPEAVDEFVTYVRGIATAGDSAMLTALTLLAANTLSSIDRAPDAVELLLVIRERIAQGN